MNTYNVKDTRYISKKTLLLTLEPQNDEVLQHFPGQYAAIGFKNDGRPSPVRCFSIASSPNSKDLQFGIRVYGDYTQALAMLEIGDEVFVHGPFGNFVIDEQYDKNVILLAGGIGVTPYVSIIQYAAEAKLKIPITLLYSCQSQDSIPFYKELIELERRNPYFKVFFFVTDGGIEKLGEGRIFNTRIEEPQLTQLTNNNFNKFTYFVCGPKGFMHAMKEILAVHNTDPDKIITEEFTPSSQDNIAVASPKYSISRWTYSLTALSLVLGTAFIMSLDVARALPKLVNAQSSQTASTSQTSTPVTNSSGNTSNTTQQNSNQSTTNSNTYTQSNQSQYQAPVTSVS